MSRAQKFGLWFAIAYVVFWFGGNYSFSYTHNCVRSHTETRVDSSGNDYTERVCDFYSANDKRWTFLDPARSVATNFVTGWVDAAFWAAIAAAVTLWVWRDRRRKQKGSAYSAAIDEERQMLELWGEQTRAERVFAVVDLRRGEYHEGGDEIEVFDDRGSAKRYLDDLRERDPKLAARVRIEERRRGADT